MKLRFLNPRFIIRFVRATESIASSLSDLRNAYYRTQGIAGSVQPDPASDANDDDIVSYTDERAIYAYQQRERERASAGFPSDGDFIPPRQ